MKLGLVLEGGASRVLFSCGVMDALLKEGIYADYVIGVSAGIAYGMSYVSRQIGRNLELSLKYLPDKRYMAIRHLFNPQKRSYYNKDFAFKEIPEKLIPYDLDAYKKYSEKTTTIAGITNIKTAKIEYVNVPADNWDLQVDLIWASCALPYLFQPVNINGNLYMDGGICDPIPYKKALSDGCDKLITVLTRERTYSKHLDLGTHFASKTFKKKYPDLSNALAERSQKYNDARTDLFALADKNEAIVITPTDTTGFRRTERNPEKLQRLYDDGYNTAMAMMPKIKKYLNISE